MKRSEIENACMCACVCVWERKNGRERKRDFVQEILQSEKLKKVCVSSSMWILWWFCVRTMIIKTEKFGASLIRLLWNILHINFIIPFYTCVRLCRLYCPTVAIYHLATKPVCLCSVSVPCRKCESTFGAVFFIAEKKYIASHLATGHFPSFGRVMNDIIFFLFRSFVHFLFLFFFLFILLSFFGNVFHSFWCCIVNFGERTHFMCQ